jgi:hypothetical protein
MKLKKDEIYAKHPLPTDEYSVTITQSYLHPRVNDPLLVLCHTVDTGKYAYQNVLTKFMLWTGLGKARLLKMCDAIGFEWYVEDTYDPLFTTQFEALRSKVNVKQVHNDRKKIIYNEIVEWNVAVGEPEYNVMKPKSVEQFNSSEQKGKPTIPVYK